VAKRNDEEPEVRFTTPDFIDSNDAASPTVNVPSPGVETFYVKGIYSQRFSGFFR
jgi:hypothetical protein